MATNFFNYKNKGIKDLRRDVFRKSRIIFCSFIWAPMLRKFYRYRYKSIADQEKTIEIELSSIEAWSRGFMYKNLSFPGQISSGEWDRTCSPKSKIINSSAKYKGIQQRFSEGMKWRDTVLFEKYREMLKQNRHVMNRRDISEVEEYYNSKVDKVFESIKKEGILPSSDENPEIAPIFVHIGRDGEFIYTNDGNHRWAMANVLGIETMPVRVWKRHALWQKKRDILLNSDPGEIPPGLKQYVRHPDIVSEMKVISDNSKAETEIKATANVLQ